MYANSAQQKATASELLDEVLEVLEQGRREYARSDNVLSNFTRLAQQLNMEPEEILLVYAVKHWDGIISYIDGHRSQRESVRGRIMDLIAYLTILDLMIHVKEEH